MFSTLTQAELAELRSRIYRSTQEAVKLVLFAIHAADGMSRAYDLAYGVQHDACQLHEILCAEDQQRSKAILDALATARTAA